MGFQFANTAREEGRRKSCAGQNRALFRLDLMASSLGFLYFFNENFDSFSPNLSPNNLNTTCLVNRKKGREGRREKRKELKNLHTLFSLWVS